MKSRVFSKLVLIFLSVFVGTAGVKDVAGLVIYRIGGEDRPPPSPELGEVVFHQLAWEDFQSELEGDINLVDIRADGIQPLRLTPELNIAETSLDRGGAMRVHVSYSITRTDATDVLIDGDPETAFGTDSKHRYRRLHLDLGGRFGVNLIQFYPRTHLPNRYLEDFNVSINDGDSRKVDSTGRLMFDPLDRVRESKAETTKVEFPTELVRHIYLYLYRPPGDKPWEIAELEVYGDGYVPASHYTSQIIDFENIASWGQIRWAGRQDLDGKVWIQTRSGMDSEPTVFWRYTGRGDETSRFDTRGREITRSAYKRLAFQERAGMTYDTENWTFWSAPYEFADSLGTAILSEGPRRFFQLKVDFLSTPSDGGGVDFLEFSASVPPPVQQVLAEISPQEARPGETTHFTYAIRASIGEDHTGFDRLEVSTPTRVGEIDSLRIDGVDVAFTVESIEDDHFVVGFPKMDSGKSGALLEVVFDTIVLRYGTSFSGKVFDSSRPHEARQVVVAGDAADELVSNDLAVITSLEGDLLHHIQVSPNPFTPNGDGLNDEVSISYDLFNLVGYAPLRVEICDLAGNLVQVAHEDELTSGRYTHVWDGKTQDGEVAPPGFYIYRIIVDADKGLEAKAGILSVAY